MWLLVLSIFCFKTQVMHPDKRHLAEEAAMNMEADQIAASKQKNSYSK